MRYKNEFAEEPLYLISQDIKHDFRQYLYKIPNQFLQIIKEYFSIIKLRNILLLFFIVKIREYWVKSWSKVKQTKISLK
ncbi:MAG: hypothetical protein K0Q49_2157 [Haloplasmataceae bacterium]|jgi:hypothetical protein|nr:hypothetical protein [Haloplasmataceae bacterium]